MRLLPFEIRFATRFSLPLLLALVAAPRLAHADVSDADRAAARELYVQGVGFQESGRFSEALDRFNRAQTVFSAPTHLLHIAECEAALGKLVESAETYRTLVRTPLPDNAPNAFVQAQKQGAAELTQVEPRLPSVRVSVRPETATNVSVQIDGQAMSSALIGVQRPTDPGAHTIVVSAPGYGRASQRVTLQEKENREVAFVLQPSNGIVYGTLPPAPLPSSTPSTAPPNQTVPLYGPAPTSAPPAPPPYAAPPEYQSSTPEHRPATGGFMIGPTLGGSIPTGALETGNAVSQSARAGAALGFEGGFRFVKRLYLGLVFQHSFLSGGSLGDSTSGTGSAITYSASANYYGLNFGYISNPEGVGFYGELGAGVRTLETDATTNGATLSQTWTGGEGSIGVGLHIKVGNWVRLIPKATISAGQFSGVSCSSPAGCNSAQSSVQGEDTHMFVFLGVTGFVDFARKH